MERTRRYRIVRGWMVVVNDSDTKSLADNQSFDEGMAGNAPELWA